MKTTTTLAVLLTVAAPCLAQTRPHSIGSVSVCSPTGTVSSASCGDGTFDTQQVVLGASGDAINENGVHQATDEHASVFPPGGLHGNSDYLFFVASGTSVNPDVGVTVLSGGAGPDSQGQWTMQFADGYGSYASGVGDVFLAPIVEGHCPVVPDATSDLNYAAAGSIVADPTSTPGSLLMIYEGANTCVGNPGGKRIGNGAYITTGIATSADDGRTWPTYRQTPTFDFVQLPFANPTEGPNAPQGALGPLVCTGIACSTIPPDAYGRYPILSTPTSLSSLVTAGQSLTDKVGDAEPSAFVDDVGDPPTRYLYVVEGYVPGDAGGPALPDQRKTDLTIARAALNGGTAPLAFSKWDGQRFGQPGIGGTEVQLLPDGAFTNCGDLSQGRHSGSISYVEDTQQYLLLFVCDSPGDPLDGAPGGPLGAAWFYATSRDLSDPTQWTTPQEITGSWNPWDFEGCPSYNGWYPTAMSLEHAAGHLTTSGYVFYLWGCQGGGNGTQSPPPRRYSSRQFTITTTDGGSGR